MKSAILAAALCLVAPSFAMAQVISSEPPTKCSDWTRLDYETWQQNGTQTTVSNTDQSRMMNMLCTGANAKF